MKHVHLLDGNAPIGARVRYAASQAKNSQWWTAELSPSNASDRQLWHQVYWRWVPSKIVFEMIPTLERDVDSMSADDFATLLTFIDADSRGAYAIGDTGTELPVRVKSPRLALLIALKDMIYAQAVFIQHYLKSTSENEIVASFRANNAWRAAAGNLLDWRRAVAIVQHEYAKWRQDSVLPFAGRPTIPEEVTRRILEHPADFPFSIWHSAIARASFAAQRSVRPVGQIARRDGWFKA